MTPDASAAPQQGHMPLNQPSQLYRNVLESMEGGVMTVDADGRIGIFNTAASRLLGLKPSETLGKTFADVFLNLEGLEAFSDTVLAAVYDRAVGNRTTVSVRLGDDTERALAVTTVYLVEQADGGDSHRSGIVAVFDDITEIETLRRAEKQLVEATERQNAELREAYRKIDDNNQALGSALKRVQAIRLVAILLVTVLFVGAAWFVWDQTGSTLLAALAPAPRAATSQGGDALTTVTVAPRPLVQTLSFVGRLAPRAEVRVTSPTAGKVARLHFEYGGSVAAGQPLIELDTAESEQRYRRARAEYLRSRDKFRELENWTNSPEITRLRRAVTRAELDLETRRSKVDETALLLRQGIIPELEHSAAERQYEAQQLSYAAAVQDLELARAKVDADALQIARLSLENAELSMRELENVISNAVIHAPVSGIVLQPGSQRHREQEGETASLSAGRAVSEGGYLLTIAEIQGLSVIGQIDEVDVVKVQPGQPARIRGAAFPDLELHGNIAQVSAQAKGAGRVPVFDVTAVIDAVAEEHRGRLLLGMSASVVVVVREEPEALLLPLVAVQGGRGAYWVRVRSKENGTPQRVPVEVGTTTLLEVEIVRGIKAGDEVIVSGG